MESPSLLLAQLFRAKIEYMAVVSYGLVRQSAQTDNLPKERTMQDKLAAVAQPELSTQSSPGEEGSAHPLPDRLYTADELAEISAQDDTHHYELHYGRLIRDDPAGYEHGVNAMSLGARLQVYAEDHNLGLVSAAETGFKLQTNPDTILAPDAAFVRAERIGDGPLPVRYFDGAPDLVVEVVSPSDTVTRVQQKVQSWLSHGTQLVWVVEPATQTVTVYRPDGSARVLQRQDTLDGETVLPGFSYPLARLFR
jgi:Uma2 family endonuclease